MVWKFWIIVCIVSTAQVNANIYSTESLNTITDPEIKAETETVLSRIIEPTDNQMQRDLKALVVQYLVETAKLESEVQGMGTGRNLLPTAYRRPASGYHHWSHRDKFNQQVTQIQPVQVIQVPVQQQQPVAAPAAVPVLAPEAARAPASVIAAAPAPATPAPTGDRAAVVPVITGEQAPAPATNAPVQQAPVAAAPAAPAPAQAPVQQIIYVPVTQVPATTRRPRPTVDPVHALNQVDKILGNVANGNIVGIVDESLAIRAPAPVRNLVTNILKVVFCNPINRLLGRCAPNQIDAANTSQTGRK